MKAAQLLDVLSDGKPHATRELVRRVGHTFAVAKFKLIEAGYPIRRRRHPTRSHQFEYQLLEAPDEAMGFRNG